MKRPAHPIERCATCRGYFALRVFLTPKRRWRECTPCRRTRHREAANRGWAKHWQGVDRFLALLSAMEAAAQRPGRDRYGEKRRAVLEYVATLQAECHRRTERQTKAA
jgi:hypothetical protein